MLALESFYSKEIANLPLNVRHPVFVNMLIKKYSKMGAEDYYAKAESVETYPEYLFRTDKEQKWTNDNTVYNICVLPSQIETKAVPIKIINNYYVYSFCDNVFIYKALLDWQKVTFTNPLENNAQKYMIHAKERIRFFSMSYEGDDVDVAANMIEVLEKIAKSESNVSPICAVAHNDEDYPHVHFLYQIDPTGTLKKKERNRIPHIDTILDV